MKKIVFSLLFLFFVSLTFCQELYVFSEPASNMPSKSISFKLTGRFPSTRDFRQRYMPEAMIGINRYLMVHLTGTFSDIYTRNLQPESGRLYVKYRFYSKDDIHKHFRMAAFGDVSFSNSPYTYDETSLEGDNSGFQYGIIATQLLNKLAISSTWAYTKLFKVNAHKIILKDPTYHFLNYSLSAGYLLLPKKYTSYNQLNVNAYAELLGAKSLQNGNYNLDLAPAIQFIFNSNSKINLGYRFQIAGNMNRMASNTYQVAFEHTFFNLWK